MIFEDRIWVPEGPLRASVIYDFHDHPLAGHPGRAKTMSLIKRTYNWKGLSRDINSYLSVCLDCARSKPSRVKPLGLLNPLQQSDAPWKSISVDFIVELPEISGFNAVMVVVDRFTKMAHFIPCSTTITSQQTIDLFISRIFSLHGLPSEIVSDRGPQFISQV